MDTAFKSTTRLINVKFSGAGVGKDLIKTPAVTVVCLVDKCAASDAVISISLGNKARLNKSKRACTGLGRCCRRPLQGKFAQLCWNLWDGKHLLDSVEHDHNMMFDDAQPLKPVFIPQFRAHNSLASARVLYLCTSLHCCRFASRKKTRDSHNNVGCFVAC